MPRQDVEILIKAIDQFSPTFGKIGGDLDTMKQKLKSIDDQFGDRSNFGKIQKMLMGGGAVGGISLAGRILNDVTAKALELKDAFDAGEKSAGQVADELAKSLPVLGKIYSAGANIHELITGEQAELKRYLSLQESIQKANESVVQTWRNIAAETGKATAEAEEYQRQIRRGMLNPDEQKKFDAETETTKKSETAEEKKKKDLAETEARFFGSMKDPAKGTINDLIKQRVELSNKEEAIRENNKPGPTNADGSSLNKKLEPILAEQRRVDDLISKKYEAFNAEKQRINDDFAKTELLRQQALNEEKERIDDEAHKREMEQREKRQTELQEWIAGLNDDALESQREAIRAGLDEVQRAAFDAQIIYEDAIKKIEAERAKLNDKKWSGEITFTVAEGLETELDNRAKQAREAAERAKADAMARDLVDREKARTDEEEKRNREAISKSNAMTSAESLLRSAEMMELESRANLGDKLAEQQLERLRIEEKYLAIAQQLTEVMNDQALSEDVRAKARAQLADSEASKQRELAGIEKKRADDAIDNLKRMRDEDKGFDASNEAGAGFASRIAQQMLLSRSVKTDFPTAPTGQPQPAPEIPGPPASIASDTSAKASDAATPSQDAPLNQQQGAEIIRLLEDVAKEFKNTQFLALNPNG